MIANCDFWNHVLWGWIGVIAGASVSLGILSFLYDFSEDEDKPRDIDYDEMQEDG